MEPTESWFNAADYNKVGNIERRGLNSFFRSESAENSGMSGGTCSGRQQ